MKTVGIICEYNPLHLGHGKQLRQIREKYGPDCGIVCAMSGNFVQRGMPAILDKSLRAKAAVLCGADLVLELPVTVALSSAEGFAAGGVQVLAPLCDTLCFGAETQEPDALMALARCLLSEAFSPALKQQLETGLSFPAARQQALIQLGQPGELLSQPNNILATEYCKAILEQNASMDIYPIHRAGSYHAQIADCENPSATAVRKLMLGSSSWHSHVPKSAVEIFDNAPLHSISQGERAILAKLRTMTDTEFEALPFGSEGLWRKLMHESRRQNTLEDILTAVKTKRYTRTRLDRMVMCAFLNITMEQMQESAPYVRVLAFTDRGREILKQVKAEGYYRNAGERIDHPYWELEKRCGDLYGLFCTEGVQCPRAEESRRVYYHRLSNQI